MAITDAYATATQYRDVFSKTDTDDDTELDRNLKAVSRYIDRRLGQFFGRDAAVVARLFDGRGTTRLWLDGMGVPGIADLTAMTVKVDLNGDYDVADSGETLTINTHFWAGPWDAADGPEAWPYTYLEINPSNSVISVWPLQQRAVEVTAIWGWPSVPEGIVDQTIQLTGIWRMESPRSTNRIAEGFDQFVSTSRAAQDIIRDLMATYRRGVLV